ncbi:Uncharacterised protein [Vibrio cholerae]|nr:Uncharacterised protein [Vibrio cholerae]
MPTPIAEKTSFIVVLIFMENPSRKKKRISGHL